MFRLQISIGRPLDSSGYNKPQTAQACWNLDFTKKSMRIKKIYSKFGLIKDNDSSLRVLLSVRFWSNFEALCEFWISYSEYNSKSKQ